MQNMSDTETEIADELSRLESELED